jgi:hypothetical protein
VPWSKNRREVRGTARDVTPARRLGHPPKP